MSTRWNVPIALFASTIALTAGLPAQSESMRKNDTSFKKGDTQQPIDGVTFKKVDGQPRPDGEPGDGTGFDGVDSKDPGDGMRFDKVDSKDPGDKLGFEKADPRDPVLGDVIDGEVDPKDPIDGVDPKDPFDGVRFDPVDPLKVADPNRLRLSAYGQPKLGSRFGLQIQGQSDEFIVLVLGLGRTELQLPQGGVLRVRPDLVLPAGTLSQNGTLTTPIDPGVVSPERLDPRLRTVFVQALSIGVLGDVDAKWKTSNVLAIDPVQGKTGQSLADRVEAKVLFDGIQYYLQVEVEVPSSDHELRFDAVAMTDMAQRGEEIMVVYLTLLEPAEGTSVLPGARKLKGQYALGSVLDGKVELWMQAHQRGMVNIPAYQKVKELATDTLR